MEHIIYWSVPLLSCQIDFLLELHRGFLLADIEEERLLHPLNRDRIKLGQVTNQHQDQQVNEDISVLSDLKECLTCQLLKHLLNDVDFGILECLRLPQPILSLLSSVLPVNQLVRLLLIVIDLADPRVVYSLVTFVQLDR